MKNVVATLGIGDLLRPGRHVLVRVTKEAIGTKGPTSFHSYHVPSRYVVLMPTVSQIGVSRKLQSREERMRLRALCRSLRRGAGGMIVRTAAEGVDDGTFRKRN